MALAAACSLCLDPAATVALAAATISAPCILASATPAEGPALGSGQTLECTAYFGNSAKSGELVIRSRTGGSSGGSDTAVTNGSLHLSCAATTLAPGGTTELSMQLHSGPAVRAIAAAICTSQNWCIDKTALAASAVATVAAPLSCAGVASCNITTPALIYICDFLLRCCHSIIACLALSAAGFLSLSNGSHPLQPTHSDKANIIEYN